MIFISDDENDRYHWVRTSSYLMLMTLPSLLLQVAGFCLTGKHIDLARQCGNDYCESCLKKHYSDTHAIEPL